MATCPYTSDKTVANTYIHTINTSKTGEFGIRMVYWHRCQYPGCGIILVSQNVTIRRKWIVYKGSLCIIFYNCMWLYNCLNKNFNEKKVCISIVVDMKETKQGCPLFWFDTLYFLGLQNNGFFHFLFYNLGYSVSGSYWKLNVPSLVAVFLKNLSFFISGKDKYQAITFACNSKYMALSTEKIFFLFQISLQINFSFTKIFF